MFTTGGKCDTEIYNSKAHRFFLYNPYRRYIYSPVVGGVVQALDSDESAIVQVPLPQGRIRCCVQVVHGESAGTRLALGKRGVLLLLFTACGGGG